MPVKRGKIYAEFYALLAAFVGHELYNVPLTLKPWRIYNAVACVSRRPKAKSVRIFAGEYKPFHACRFYSFYPLLRVNLGRIKIFLGLASGTLLAVCECVHSEVNKGRELKFCERKLIF